MNRNSEHSERLPSSKQEPAASKWRRALISGVALLARGICSACSIHVAIIELDVPAAVAIRTIPIPPNSVIYQSARKGIRFQDVIHLASRDTYFLNSSVMQMIVFYETELDRSGWTKVKEEFFEREDVCLVFNKASVFRASVEIFELATQTEPNRIEVTVDTRSAPIPGTRCK